MPTPIFVRRSRSRAGLVGALVDRAAPGDVVRPGLAALLDDLPRRLHRVPLPFLLGRRVRAAYGWEASDRTDEQWWPQGVTTADDARATGHAPAGLGDRDVAVVTWYAKHDQGVRLTFVDLRSRRYRHVLLVTPVERYDGSVGLDPVKAHAGGIVWAGSWLHVAATGKGCVSAHLDDLLWLAHPRAVNRTFGHRWVLPTRVDHRGGADEGAAKLRWSFLSLDAGAGSATPTDADGPSVLVGEYGRGDASTRLARFPLQPDGRFLPDADDARTTRAVEVVDAALPGMQGVAAVDGRLHVTTSHGPWGPGSVHVRDGGGWTRTPAATPMGPEDLSYSARTRSLWTPTEHPRRRWLVSLRPTYRA
ncbi:hypothetical protein RDV89_13350 [Nocardioides zeae]|uniref:Phage tail protein n=1 Tax=Nocardioides imazamoxiresistens TaxID=3231893 RepID=A0ABU3PXU3_9ACTN|nr:hypothetical protein [Nocardioides zeae]MDT9594063.1 hypothetical protein [Nocardioides zeae]